MSRATSPRQDDRRSRERADRAADRELERRVWSDRRRARTILNVANALSFAGAACWVAFALLLADVVGRAFLQDARLGSLAVPIAAMLALVLARAGFLWGGEVVAQRAAEDVKTGLRERLGTKLAELGPTYTRGERTGELVHAAGEGVEALGPYVTRFRPARTLAAAVPVAIALVVFALDPWTVTILVVTGPVLVLLLDLIGRRVRDQTRRRERELAWMSAHFLDVLRGLPTLKLFGRSAEQAETLEDVGRRYGATTMDVLRTAFQTTLVLEWGATAATALVAIETSVRLMAGVLAFETALAVLLLTPEFFLPLRRLAADYHAGRAGAAAASRVSGILDEPVRISKVPRRVPSPERFDIRFDDVHVSFDGGSRRALSACSFHVPEGSLVAVVGPTGAGKTTVANVLLRFVEPDRGSVLVGGTRLDEIDPQEWRERVALVPQHPYLFHGTIAENLRLARPSATDGELEVAATAAHAHAFIERLSDGYATQVGEGGARLSGGERQRLAIARAFLRDAPLVVLDEPLAQLDPEAETAVIDAIEALARSRTALVITHRPERFAGADVIALDGGRVVEWVPSRGRTRTTTVGAT
jgi:ATP-binding cassette, subfamily C, bacterial CydD